MFGVYRVVKFREQIVIRVVSWFLRGGTYVVVSNYQNGSIGSHENEEKKPQNEMAHVYPLNTLFLYTSPPCVNLHFTSTHTELCSNFNT